MDMAEAHNGYGTDLTQKVKYQYRHVYSLQLCNNICIDCNHLNDGLGLITT